MLKTKKVMQELGQITSIVCDRCGEEIKPSNIIEWQESYSISFIGGYSSVFGDGAIVTCDLCQQCLKTLIGDFCVYGDD